MSKPVLLGFPLERHFVRRPWLAVLFVLGVYVLGALLDGAP